LPRKQTIKELDSKVFNYFYFFGFGTFFFAVGVTLPLIEGFGTLPLPLHAI